MNPTAAYFTASLQKNRQHTAEGAYIEAIIVFPAAADAKDFIGEFPKSVKLYSPRSGCGQDNRVYCQVSLVPNDATGSRNETGEKRWASFRKHLARLGVTLEYRAPYLNSLSADDAAAL